MEEMEQWEIDLRAKLEKELPEGIYELSNDAGFVALTGKQGKINYEVEFMREVRKYRGYESEIQEASKDAKVTYKGLTVDDFMQFMKDLENFNKPKNE